MCIRDSIYSPQNSTFKGIDYVSARLYRIQVSLPYVITGLNITLYVTLDWQWISLVLNIVVNKAYALFAACILFLISFISSLSSTIQHSKYLNLLTISRFSGSISNFSGFLVFLQVVIIIFILSVLKMCIRDSWKDGRTTASGDVIAEPSSAMSAGRMDWTHTTVPSTYTLQTR